MSETKNAPVFLCQCLRKLEEPYDMPSAKNFFFALTILGSLLAVLILTNHTLALTSIGELFSWRVNYILAGCLGLGASAAGIGLLSSRKYREVNRKGYWIYGFCDDHGTVHKHADSPELRSDGFWVRGANGDGRWGYRKVVGHVVKLGIGGNLESAILTNDGGVNLNVWLKCYGPSQIVLGVPNASVTFPGCTSLLQWLNAELPYSGITIPTRTVEFMKVLEASHDEKVRQLARQRDDLHAKLISLFHLVQEFKRRATRHGLTKSALAVEAFLDDALQRTLEEFGPAATTVAVETAEARKQDVLKCYADETKENTKRASATVAAVSSEPNKPRDQIQPATALSDFEH